MNVPAMNPLDAEILKQFSQELGSIVDSRPPISKAKMMQVTKAAMKGMKHFKHVVLSVEKFIHRCKPEYKLPGLYVVDSIVRQSRHQNGSEKDSFGPRFCKNFQDTIRAAFSCLETDKPKIIRILNLWLQNGVFPAEIIKPVLENAANNLLEHDRKIAAEKVDLVNRRQKQDEIVAFSDFEKEVDGTISSDHSKRSSKDSKKRISSDKTSTANFMAENLESSVDPDLLQQIKKLTSTLVTHKPTTSDPERKLTKKILADYEYSDDEQESFEEESRSLSEKELSNNIAAAAQNLLKNPQILEQIQKMQKSISKEKTPPSTKVGAIPSIPMPPVLHPPAPQPQISSLAHHPSQIHSVNLPSSFPGQPTMMLHQQVNMTSKPTLTFNTAVPPVPFGQPTSQFFQAAHHGVAPPPIEPIPTTRHRESSNNPPPAEPLPPGFFGAQQQQASKSQDQDHRRPEHNRKLEDRDERRRDNDSKKKRKSRSRSRDRKRKRKSRSRSRDKKESEEARSRDHSSNRRHNHSKSPKDKIRDKEKEKEKDKDRERRSQGMVAVKPNHLSVYTRTLWFGRLSATCEPDEIRDAVKKYGLPDSIDIIPPRGCAYVVMPDRKSAFKVLDRLKDLQISKRIIRMAWALNKGVKNETSIEWDWDIDNGVSHLPWSSIPPNRAQNLSIYADGGSLDVESLPEHLQPHYDEKGLKPQNQQLHPMLPGGTISPQGLPVMTAQGMMLPSSQSTAANPLLQQQALANFALQQQAMGFRPFGFSGPPLQLLAQQQMMLARMPSTSMISQPPLPQSQAAVRLPTQAPVVSQSQATAAHSQVLSSQPQAAIVGNQMNMGPRFTQASLQTPHQPIYQQQPQGQRILMHQPPTQPGLVHLPFGRMPVTGYNPTAAMIRTPLLPNVMVAPPNYIPGQRPPTILPTNVPLPVGVPPIPQGQQPNVPHMAQRPTDHQQRWARPGNDQGQTSASAVSGWRGSADKYSKRDYNNDENDRRSPGCKYNKRGSYDHEKDRVSSPPRDRSRHRRDFDQENERDSSGRYNKPSYNRYGSHHDDWRVGNDNGRYSNPYGSDSQSSGGRHGSRRYDNATDEHGCSVQNQTNNRDNHQVDHTAGPENIVEKSSHDQYSFNKFKAINQKPVDEANINETEKPKQQKKDVTEENTVDLLSMAQNRTNEFDEQQKSPVLPSNNDDVHKSAQDQLELDQSQTEFIKCPTENDTSYQGNLAWRFSNVEKDREPEGQCSKGAPLWNASVQLDSELNLSVDQPADGENDVVETRPIKNQPWHSDTTNSDSESNTCSNVHALWSENNQKLIHDVIQHKQNICIDNNQYDEQQEDNKDYL